MTVRRCLSEKIHQATSPKTKERRLLKERLRHCCRLPSDEHHRLRDDWRDYSEGERKISNKIMCYRTESLGFFYMIVWGFDKDKKSDRNGNKVEWELSHCHETRCLDRNHKLLKLRWQVSQHDIGIRRSTFNSKWQSHAKNASETSLINQFESCEQQMLIAEPKDPALESNWCWKVGPWCLTEAERF